MTEFSDSGLQPRLWHLHGLGQLPESRHPLAVWRSFPGQNPSSLLDHQEPDREFGDVWAGGFQRKLVLPSGLARATIPSQRTRTTARLLGRTYRGSEFHQALVVFSGRSGIDRGICDRTQPAANAGGIDVPAFPRQPAE